VIPLFNDLTILFLKRQSERVSEQRKRLPSSEFSKAAELSKQKSEIEKKIRYLGDQGRRQKGRN